MHTLKNKNRLTFPFKINDTINEMFLYLTMETGFDLLYIYIYIPIPTFINI